MEAAPSLLAHFWAGVIAVSILTYVILDGFDIGVGILFGLTADQTRRSRMISSIAPFWDGNETWLIVIGASLFAAFPAAYAVFLGAFYLPVLLLLVGLIFRGVAFEFRHRSTGMRRFWDWGFVLGSTLAAFVQGAAVGAMMRGIPIDDRQFSGSPFIWLHPFPVLTGIGLILGYCLLGAGWLAFKTRGDLREWAFALVPRLVAAVFAVVALAFVVSLAIDTGAVAQGNLAARPWGLAFPAGGGLALLGAVAGARRRIDHLPFLMTVLFFLAAFATLAVMFWPYMIPYGLTVSDAAAPDASLRFFFFGGAVALPLTAAYTIGVYWLFRGKSEDG